MTCEICSRELTGRQTRYCSKRCGWVAWERRHPDYRPRYRDGKRALCETCGVLTGRTGGRPARRCQRCYVAEHTARRATIVRRWRDGATAQAIADELGTSRGSIEVTIVKLRKARGAGGVPYRRGAYARRAAA